MNVVPPCTELDPELFFPDPAKARKMLGRSAIEMTRITIIALDACARCPMQKECLQNAVNSREAYGIFGGTMPHERNEVAPIPVGQPTGFIFYAKLRASVLTKRKDLVCPPLPKPTKEFVPYSDYLPFVRVYSQE
jgi:hypothetical protein